MVMFETHESIDLDEDTCIFTNCGHVLTVSTMDGIMAMDGHYERNATTGEFAAIRRSPEPFSLDELRSCPSCRGPLRNLARYGRIVRRAALDESAKRFTAWSNRAHQRLSERLLLQQERLLTTIDKTTRPDQNLRLVGNVSDQINAIRNLRTHTRYHEVLRVRKDIQTLSKKLSVQEQPYQRVRDLVETVRRQHEDTEIDAFEFSRAELQLRESVQAKSLVIRSELLVLSDVINRYQKESGTVRKSVLSASFGVNRDLCDEIIEEAAQTINVYQEVEGLLFWAKFAAMECQTMSATEEEERPGTIQLLDRLKADGLSQLRKAEDACTRLPDQTAHLLDEAADIRRMLEEGKSWSEMRMVVAVMAKEFSGTGHWYRCVNGHPFTVGECGMPMQLARCPACGEGIGGERHRPTDGVTAAGDIEIQFGGLRVR